MSAPKKSLDVATWNVNGIRAREAQFLDWVALDMPYIPNGGKDYPAKLEFMRQMQDYVRQIHYAGERLIICGDMNVALTDADIHPTHNKPGIIGTRPEERKLLQEILDQGLVDVARMLEPGNNRLLTWWPYWRTARQRNLGWRIDYIFAPASLARSATSSVVHREIGTSDHGPVIATFEVESDEQ